MNSQIPENSANDEKPLAKIPPLNEKDIKILEQIQKMDPARLPKGLPVEASAGDEWPDWFGG